MPMLHDMGRTIRKGTILKSETGLKFKFESDIVFNSPIILIGPNGIGKSTFSKILAGIEGFKILESPVNELPLLKGIRMKKSRFLYHPQEMLFFPGTLRDNLDIIGFLKDKSNSALDIKKEIEENIKELHSILVSKTNLPIHNFSGGERQMIMLLRTIFIACRDIEENMKNFDGIILDEPSKQLSASQKLNSLRLIKFLYKMVGNQSLYSIVLISHDFSFIIKFIIISLVFSEKVELIEINEETGKENENIYITRIIRKIGVIKKENVRSLEDINSLWEENLLKESSYLEDLFGVNFEEILSLIESTDISEIYIPSYGKGKYIGIKNNNNELMCEFI